MLGKHGWDLLKNYCKHDDSASKTFTVAIGNFSEVIGSVLLTIHLLLDRVKLFEMLVIPSIIYYIILDVDFWRGMNVIPDPHWVNGILRNSQILNQDLMF